MNNERKYQAFYTKSTPIVDFMVEKLQIKATDKIFEPCGGDGVFVEAILDNNEFAHIDICELNPVAVQTLRNKFSSYRNVTVRECDTLLDEDLILYSKFGSIYDKIIANPPYGAWQDYEKRTVLKKLYPELYAKETYTLFLHRCIELLKDDGILSFIIPDTFLNLHMHKAIRAHILKRTKILDLTLFPSSFFPGVNFGYANLSIITLQKNSNEKSCLSNEFNVVTGFGDVEQLTNISNENLKVFTFTQQEIFANKEHALFISDDIQIVNAINHSILNIGDIANCVTGFYSGDDKSYLQVISNDLKNGKNYMKVNQNKVCHDYNTTPNILNGIDNDKCFIPILKGGNTKYYKPESWYMNWSRDAVVHYKKDKKARFQNPQYYFKFGIGVPMISSSSITAALIDHKLFDQSIVGIFPNDERLTYYLLAFFNSPTCNKLIRTINPSANNPANYIKKIPFIFPNEETLNFINAEVELIIGSIRQGKAYDGKIENEINQIFIKQYGF